MANFSHFTTSFSERAKKVVSPLQNYVYSNPVAPYVIAVAVSFLSVAIRLFLDPLLVPTRAAFLVPLIAVTFTAIFAGFTPALLTEVLCGIGITFFVLPPRLTFYPKGPEIEANIITYLVGGAIFAGLGSFVYRARRAKDEMAQHLEKLVEERTRELIEAHAIIAEEAELRFREQKQRVELLRRLMGSEEAQRSRIGRDIHDHLGQRLTGLRLQLQSLKEVMENDPADEAAKLRVETLNKLSQELDAEVSYLAWELRPTALDKFGLVETLRLFVQEWSKQNDVNGEFKAAQIAPTEFDKEVETQLYRITQEALNNISKHAQAKNISVQITPRDGKVSLIIEDDGRGFEPVGWAKRASSLGGLGLRGIHERAELIGGEVDIQSNPGNGTTIFVRIATPPSQRDQRSAKAVAQ